ncbi:MAG: UDP-glucose/GDP-mannose dehydrogenase family protein [Candidatus Sericytochromatia bacterium]
MKIAVIGTGYVGLVTGTCFSEMGNDVICADINENKIEGLKKGIIPIYEPGLEELVKRNYKEKRLNFTTNIKEAIEKSLIIFIAVDTPANEDGTPNLNSIKKVSETIGEYINSYKIIVNKSTVPVGTADFVKNEILSVMKKREIEFEFDMVSNPEFLKEGAAIDDFMKPDRVVIGTDNVRTAEIMKELYSSFVRNEHPIICMDIKSAEMTKYAANAFLATKISFINEIANICELLGADVTNVRKGIAADNRIGNKFLYPGVGYGGSCFPKDVKILIDMAKNVNYEAKIFESVNNLNNYQKNVLVDKIISYFNKEDLTGYTFGVWGLAFKPHTDDVREAPSEIIIKNLIKRGAKIKAFDPEAIDTFKTLIGNTDSITYFDNMYELLENISALLLITEWPQFRKPDFDKLKELMKEKIIFDGRNQYDPFIMKKLGFEYICIGR